MCFGVVLLYVWLAARSKIIEKRVFWHVFWHRIYIRLARNPFKINEKRVFCGTCFGNLRANEEVDHMNIAPLTFYVCHVS